MSNLIRAFICALIFLPLTSCKSFAQESVESPRNVVFMVGDGMGFAHVKAYRMYADDPSTDLVEPYLLIPSRWVLSRLIRSL